MMPDKALQAENRSEGLAPVPAARRLFAAYGDAISRLNDALGAPFEAAVEMILATSGHVGLCFFIPPKPFMAILAWCGRAMS